MRYDMPIAVRPEFEVLFEDEDVLAVNKAAPLLCHPTGAKNEPTLLHGLQALLAFELAAGGQVSLINRLDRETSGVVLAAKNRSAAGALGRAMQQRLVMKAYLAFVVGRPLWERAWVDEPVLRMERVAPTRIHVRQCCHPSGKPCGTEFRVLKRFPARGRVPEFAMVECFPHTGRMHQIRVHAAHLGFPLLGDKIYGGDEELYLNFIAHGWTPDLEERLILPRHALHASRMEFPHRGRTVVVEAPLPQDMADLI